MSYTPLLFDKFTTLVDATIASSSKIGTPIKNFVIINMRETLVNVDAVVALHTRSLGTNATSYDNLVTSSIVTNLVVLNDINIPNLTTSKGFVSGGTSIYYNTTIAATATQCMVKIEVIGYYQ